jgi:rubrerythrin
MTTKRWLWVCPKCGNSVMMFVKVTQPPTCSDHKSKKVVEMVDTPVIQPKKA